MIIPKHSTRHSPPPPPPTSMSRRTVLTLVLALGALQLAHPTALTLRLHRLAVLAGRSAGPTRCVHPVLQRGQQASCQGPRWQPRWQTGSKCVGWFWSQSSQAKSGAASSSSSHQTRQGSRRHAHGDGPMQAALSSCSSSDGRCCCCARSRARVVQGGYQGSYHERTGGCRADASSLST